MWGRVPRTNRLVWSRLRAPKFRQSNWRSRPTTSNPSQHPTSLVTGKLTGKIPKSGLRQRRDQRFNAATMGTFWRYSLRKLTGKVSAITGRRRSDNREIRTTSNRRMKCPPYSYLTRLPPNYSRISGAHARSPLPVRREGVGRNWPSGYAPAQRDQCTVNRAVLKSPRPPCLSWL
jgi:hypothetical protein